MLKKLEILKNLKVLNYYSYNQKMSFICQKCSKKLASKQALQKHLDRVNPCVLSCCGHLYTSNKYYHNHRRDKHETETEVKSKVADLELEKLKLQLQIKQEETKIKQEETKKEKVKLKRAKVIKKKAVMIVLPDRRPELHEVIVPFEETGQYIVNSASKITFETKETSDFIQTRLIAEQTQRKFTNEESQQMSKSIFGMQDLVGKSLECLAYQESGFKFLNLHNMLHQVLDHVHLNKNNPELYNVMIADKSRMIITFFSQVTDPPSWIKLSKNNAFKKISTHLRSLVRSFIEAALLQMKPFLINGDSGDKPVFGCAGKTDSTIILHDSRKDILIVDIVPNKAITEYNAATAKEHTKAGFVHLMSKIDARKTEIMPAIEQMIFNDENIIGFLQRSETISPLRLTGPSSD